MSRIEYRRQLNRPMGAVAALWPDNLDPQLIDHQSEPEIGMSVAPLTAAGELLAVSTPGHSYGHQFVLLRTPEIDLFFAGDMVFTERQLSLRPGLLHRRPSSLVPRPPVDSGNR